MRSVAAKLFTPGVRDGWKADLLNLPAGDPASVRRNELAVLQEPVEWTTCRHLAGPSAVYRGYADDDRKDYDPCHDHPSFRGRIHRTLPRALRYDGSTSYNGRACALS